MHWKSQDLIFFFYYICLFSEKLVGMAEVGGKGGEFKGVIVNLMHILKSQLKTPLY